MLNGIRFEAEAADRPLISYLEGFWKPDSPYVKECASIRKNPLSARYVLLNEINVRLHIRPFPRLNKITLRELTAGLIRDWMTWIAAKRLSGRTVNYPQWIFEILFRLSGYLLCFFCHCMKRALKNDMPLLLKGITEC